MWYFCHFVPGHHLNQTIVNCCSLPSNLSCEWKRLTTISAAWAWFSRFWGSSSTQLTLRQIGFDSLQFKLGAGTSWFSHLPLVSKTLNNHSNLLSCLEKMAVATKMEQCPPPPCTPGAPPCAPCAGATSAPHGGWAWHWALSLSWLPERDKSQVGAFEGFTSICVFD